VARSEKSLDVIYAGISLAHMPHCEHALAAREQNE
jgi:hypothetical protein